MINYYHELDQTVARHYAVKLNDAVVQKIVESGWVGDKNEAYALSKFYWAMVDASVLDRDSSGEPFSNMDKHLENIFNAFYIYLGNHGYDEQWSQATDEA